MAPQTLSTSCPMDCPDTCALEVAVGPSGVEAIGGASAPLTDGFICSKVARFDRRLRHPGRLITPLRRNGTAGEGRFAPISWSDAVAEITERFGEIVERYGGEAILPYHYGGSNGLLSEGFLDRLYFARLGASRLAKTICAAPTSAVAGAMYGAMPGVAFEDYAEAELILLWGTNPRVSHIHLVPHLERARQRGAKIVAIDPARTLSERQLDLHLPVLPGTDLPVALALIRLLEERGHLDVAFLTEQTTGLEALLERAREWRPERAAAVAGVPPGAIVRLAEAYAAASPAVIRVGWGLERNRHGGQAVAAALALPALAGKFGVRGGGYTLSNSRAVRHGVDRLLGHPPWSTRRLNMTRLGALIDPLAPPPDPPIKGLFVYNANPVATVPDQEAILRGLEREDLFTVVFDQVMTDTARHADLVLPATTFLEHYDLKVGYGNYLVGGVRPVVPRVGQARPNTEVFAELGRAMGFTDAPFSWDEETCLRKVAGTLELNDRPADVETLMAGGWQRVEFAGGTPIQLGNVFPATPDGRIDLAPAVLGETPYTYQPPADTATGLALISPASPHLVNSTLGELERQRFELTLHPDEAAARGIVDGDLVRVFNDQGEVLCRVRLSDLLRPGVARLPKGIWERSSANGRTSTALTPPRLEPVAGGACFNDVRVEVERAPESAPGGP